MRIKLKLIVGLSVLLFSVNIFAASKVHLDKKEEQKEIGRAHV